MSSNFSFVLLDENFNFSDLEDASTPSIEVNLKTRWEMGAGGIVITQNYIDIDMQRTGFDSINPLFLLIAKHVSLLISPLMSGYDYQSEESLKVRQIEFRTQLNKYRERLLLVWMMKEFKSFD